MPELSVGVLESQGTVAHSKTEAVYKVSRCARVLTFVKARVAS